MKLKLLTPLLLIAITLFFVANANTNTNTNANVELDLKDPWKNSPIVADCVATPLTEKFKRNNNDPLDYLNYPIVCETPLAQTKEEVEIERKKQAKIEKKRVERSAYCAKEAGKANTEYAAMKIETTCLAEKELEPESKSWFDW